MSSTHVDAPFTDDQVASLNDYQTSGVFHPFTCGEHSQHPEGTLEATTDGWHCRVDGCDYTQTWAHTFMADRSWEPLTAALPTYLRRLETDVAALQNWDMLTLDANGRGVACADAPWARRTLDGVTDVLDELRKALEPTTATRSASRT